MLTHYNLIANLLQLEGSEGKFFTPSDVTCGVLPFFHIYGMQVFTVEEFLVLCGYIIYLFFFKCTIQVILNFSLWKGATVITMAKFDLKQFLELSQSIAYLLLSLYLLQTNLYLPTLHVQQNTKPHGPTWCLQSFCN